MTRSYEETRFEYGPRKSTGYRVMQWATGTAVGAAFIVALVVVFFWARSA